MAPDAAHDSEPHGATPIPMWEVADHEWRAAMQQARGYAQLMKGRLADPTVSHHELGLLMEHVLVGLERLRSAQMQLVTPLLSPTANDEGATSEPEHGDQGGHLAGLPPEPLPAAGVGESPLLLLVAFAVLLLLLSYR